MSVSLYKIVKRNDMTDRRSRRQQCVNDRNSIRYPVDIDDRWSTLHSRHLGGDMLVEWNQNNDRPFFLSDTFLITKRTVAFCKPPRWAAERTTNLVSARISF